MIVISRQSASSSTGSTVVAEEPEAVLQGVEDVITDVKLSESLLDYSSLQGRIQELKQENEEKLQSVTESVEREKAELRRAHAIEMEFQRHKHQEALEKLQRETRQAEERTNDLACELDMLQGELTARNETVREMQVQVRDLSSAKEELQGILQNLKMDLGEMEAMAEELRYETSALNTNDRNSRNKGTRCKLSLHEKKRYQAWRWKSWHRITQITC